MTSPTRNNMPCQSQSTKDLLNRGTQFLENSKITETNVTLINGIKFFALGALSGLRDSTNLLKATSIARDYFSSKQIEPLAAGMDKRLEPRNVSYGPEDILQRIPVGSRSRTFSNSSANDATAFSPSEAGIEPSGNLLKKEKPITPPCTDNLPPLSLDIMKNGIKNALMDARKEGGTDGTNGKKAHLNDIVLSARNSILVKSGVYHPDDVTIQYPHTANLAKRNLETFIHSVAPNVNARLTAEVVLIKAAGAERSSVCVDLAAKAALEDIDRQNQGVRAVLKAGGDVIYSATKMDCSDSRPERTNSHNDRMEANPYSPMGPPTGSPASNNGNEVKQTELTQHSVAFLETNRDFGTVANNDRRSEPSLWDMGYTAGKAIYDGCMAYGDMRAGQPYSAFERSCKVSEGLIELGHQVIEKFPPGDPPDFEPPSSLADCDGPIFPRTHK